MTISDIRVVPEKDGFRLEGRVRSSTTSLDKVLWYEARRGTVEPSMEMAGAALTAAALPTAVWLKEDLEVEGDCDAEFLSRATDIARGKARLHRLPQRIAVSGKGSTAVPRDGRVVGCSFSGGIDSMFSVLNHLKPGCHDPVGAVVTVFGIDLRWEDEESHARELGKLLPFSSELGLQHYTVRTNFREVFDPYADWSLFTHGSCVISVGFVLSGSLHTYLVPCSASIDRLYPWGSHALLDNAFIASEMITRNDAWEWHRNEKVEEVAKCPLALKHLRVCNKMLPVGNCGVCEKCVRTMALLMLCGKLEETTCFHKKIEPSDLADFRIKKDAELFWFGQMEKEAREKGLVEMAAALGVAIRNGRRRVWRRGLEVKLGIKKAKARSQNDD